jgi:hypothetical protein
LVVSFMALDDGLIGGWVDGLIGRIVGASSKTFSDETVLLFLLAQSTHQPLPRRGNSGMPVTGQVPGVAALQVVNASMPAGICAMTSVARYPKGPVFCACASAALP